MNSPEQSLKKLSAGLAALQREEEDKLLSRYFASLNKSRESKTPPPGQRTALQKITENIGEGN